MTAPDDVRARFEVSAWQRRIKPDSGKWLEWEYFAGAVDYDNDRARFPDRVGRWECEYRPLYAHAHPSGEVRELVEAAKHMRENFRCVLDVNCKCDSGFIDRQTAEFDAALAKFHHQEKP